MAVSFSKPFHQPVSTFYFYHHNGVEHYDLKSQNLLLDTANNLKVSNFEDSVLSGQLKNGLLHTTHGMSAYTEPEILCGRRKGYDGSPCSFHKFLQFWNFVNPLICCET